MEFFAFDALNAGGKDLTTEPLEERRTALSKLVGATVRLSPTLESSAGDVLEAVKNIDLLKAIFQ